MDALLPFLLDHSVVYGFLLVPEDLGEPNAVDLLMQTLSTLYVLPVSPTDSPSRTPSSPTARRCSSGPLQGPSQAFQVRLKESRLAARTAASAHPASGSRS